MAQCVFVRCNTVRRIVGSVRGYRLSYMNTVGMLSDGAVCVVRVPSAILSQIAVCAANDAL